MVRKISAVVLDLQVDQPNGVTRLTHRCGDELEAERLQPQKHLSVKQRARMDPEKPHRIFPLVAAAAEHHRASRAARWQAGRTRIASTAGLGAVYGVLPTRVASTKLSVAASMARPLRPRGG